MISDFLEAIVQGALTLQDTSWVEPAVMEVIKHVEPDAEVKCALFENEVMVSVYRQVFGRRRVWATKRWLRWRTQEQLEETAAQVVGWAQHLTMRS